MSTNYTNPLTKHFRKPAIYLKLPSKGRFWETGITMPDNGELPIYPMTAKDEITLRTPDALLNGQGVIDVIESCCPNITDAWRMPSVDVDALLIAIRIASYGTDMQFDAKCQHCNETDSYGIDLNYVLDHIKLADYASVVSNSDNVSIKLRPQEYFSLNATNQIKFEEQKILNAINVKGVSPEIKLAEFRNHMNKIVGLNNKLLVDSTDYIDADGEIVTNKEFIAEYYTNCPGNVIKEVQTKLKEIAEASSIKPAHLTCASCQGEYDVSITFDHSSFFGLGS